jgi:hypothetical protein
MLLLFRRIGLDMQPDTAACLVAMPQLRQNVDQASFRFAFNSAAFAAVARAVVFPPVDEPVPRAPFVPAKKILPVDGAGRASALSLSGACDLIRL